MPSSESKNHDILDIIVTVEVISINLERRCIMTLQSLSYWEIAQ